jgi:hypothetical protein
MFSVSTDPARKLVRLKISAMLTAEQVAELYRREHMAILGMGCRLGDQLCIVDLTDCPLQLQDVVGAFQREIKSGAKARRLAMFTGNALARMQARRIMQRDDAAIFETREEAEAWLFDARAKAA